MRIKADLHGNLFTPVVVTYKLSRQDIINILCKISTIHGGTPELTANQIEARVRNHLTYWGTGVLDGTNDGEVYTDDTVEWAERMVRKVWRPVKE